VSGGWGGWHVTLCRRGAPYVAPRLVEIGGKRYWFGVTSLHAELFVATLADARRAAARTLGGAR
jgi:hypothetical protein